MTPNVNLVAWVPDADPTTPGVIADLTNMLPTQRGYAPDRNLAESTWNYTGLPAACLGASLLKFSSNLPVVVAGTSTDLYSFFSAVNNVSRSASPYTTIVDPLVAWRFEAFGDVALAVSRDNVLQYSAGPASGVDFADVTGAPAATTMCVQSNFVLLGNMVSGAWPYPDGVWCSGIETYDDWDADLATQGKQMRLLQTPGEIVRLYAFGNYVIAFKYGSMLRGTYVGLPNVWRWDVISTSVGLVAHDAVCDAQGVLYWMARDGFYRFNGGSVQRISSAPFEWLLANIVSASLYSRYVQCHWDSVRRVVRWYFPYATDSLSLQHGLAYHPDTDRWGKFDCNIEWATSVYYNFVPRGVSDTGVLQYFVPAVFNISHELSVYGDDAAYSVVTTGDVGDDDQATAVMRVRSRMMPSPDTSTLIHYYRNVLSDTLTEGESIARSDGKHDISHGARWHRFAFSQTGSYELLGFSVDAKPAGKR